MGMILLRLVFVLVLLEAGARNGLAQSAVGNGAMAAITLPSGTQVEMALTRPVWAKTAKAGETLYLQTVFPVTIANQIGIPAGTYVEGTIDSVVAPTRKVSRAEVDVHFNQIIFANGYTVVLSGPGETGTAGSASADRLAATLSKVMVQVSRNNDILLDNGSQIEMTLEGPLSLDASKVARAVLLSKAPTPGQFKSATLCRPTEEVPGTPGTPDTVIPGTSPTIIPGVDGMPDTVFPGSSPIVVPGTPGTPDIPGTVCPAPPLVVSSAPEGVIVKQTPSTAPTAKK
jgi:hypothetical protein